MAISRDVFVSYSHEDRSAVAQLVRALQAQGISVRLDDDLEAGSNVDDELSRLLSDAAAVVVVWSAASAQSSFVLREAALAQDDGKLIPVSIDGTIPSAFDALQTLLLTDWRGESDHPGIGRLASELAKRLTGFDDDKPAPSAASQGSSTALPARLTLRPEADELLRLALSVSLARGAKAVSGLDVLLAVLLQPEQSQLNPRELEAGATAGIRRLVPPPGDERLARALSSVGVDRSRVQLLKSDVDSEPGLETIVAGADATARRVGAKETFAHHVVAAALSGERIEPSALSSLGVDEEELRVDLRIAIGARYPSESALEWDAILRPFSVVPGIPTFLDRVFAVDTLGSQGIRGVGVLLDEATVVTSLAAVDALPIVSIESLGSEVSSQASVVGDDTPDLVRPFAVLEPLAPLKASSDPLRLADASPVAGVAAEVVIVTRSGEPRVVRGLVTASDPTSLGVEIDPVPPDDVISGAPILAGGRVIGLVSNATGRRVTAIPVDVIRSVIETVTSAAPTFAESASGDEGAGAMELASAAAESTSPSPETQSDTAERPAGRAPLLAGAAADTVPTPGNGRVRKADRLGVTEEVEMLVSVLLAKDTPLPLAVGLFGDWGSGKSFFMALMEERMGELSTMAANKVSEAQPYCGNVRTVRFNAWHYVDADLWASLAATLFDELAKDPSVDEADKALVKLDEARAEVGTAKIKRINLERECDDLEKETGRATAAWRPSLAVALHALRNDQDLLSDLKAVAASAEAAAGGDDASGSDREADAKAADEKDAAAKDNAARVAEALGAAETLGEKARDARRLFRKEVVRRRRAGLVTLLVFLGVGGLWWWLSHDAGRAVLAFVVALLAGLTPALAATTRILGLAREAREARERPLELKQEELAKARAAEQIAAREVERRESEVREMRDKGLQLQNFVRERAASADYRSRLGVMSQVRHDFEQLVSLIPPASSGKQGPGASTSRAAGDVADPKATRETAQQQAALAEEVRKHIPGVERIVLFIDDLDRCPDDKVVDVLQAVHLLLAFELFIVVVGVDSRWLVRSLNAHFEKLLEEPAQYLEKIFQIPYILRPMSTESYRDLIVELTPSPKKRGDSTNGRDATGSRPGPPGLQATGGDPTAAQSLAPGEPDATGSSDKIGTNALPAEDSRSAAAEGEATDGADESRADYTAPEEHSGDEAHREAQDQEQEEPPEPPPEAPPALPRSEALFISAEERRVLGELDGLSLTPRSTKRLVNIYRMLRVSVPDTEFSDFDPDHGRQFEVVVVLLGILVGCPAEVSDVFSAVMSQPEDAVFKDVLKRDHPQVYKPLKDLLGQVGPHGMAAYQRWAPRVARFSFRLSGGIPVVQEEDPAPELTAQPAPGAATETMPSHADGSAPVE